VVEQLTQTVSQPKQTVCSDTVAKFLESNGWHRSVAGDKDFDLAVKAVTQAHNCGRGVFVAGSPGCGKTALLKALAKNYHNSTFLYCKEPGDLLYMRRCDPSDYNSIFIDDLGCEEIVKEYGNTVDIVGDFIQRLHARYSGRVFISSNNGLKWMNERYGGRVMDRVLEMCVCFQMKGKSKRERMVLQ